MFFQEVARICPVVGFGMATRNQQSDSPSLNLFPEDPTENSSAPGDSQPQKAARKSSRGTGVQVVQQPMSSIATKAVSGAITRQMMLTWLKIVQVIQQQPKADVYQIPMPVLMEFLGDKNKAENHLTSPQCNLGRVE